MAHNGQEHSILVVDDHETNIDLISRILRRTDYKVLTAFDGVEALRVLETHTPSMIISDVMMPNMDGMELLQQVRLNGNLNGVPFVFVSAKGTREDIAAGLALGADDYLTKPFRPQEFLATVRRIIEG